MNNLKYCDILVNKQWPNTFSGHPLVFKQGQTLSHRKSKKYFDINFLHKLCGALDYK